MNTARRALTGSRKGVSVSSGGYAHAKGIDCQGRGDPRRGHVRARLRFGRGAARLRRVPCGEQGCAPGGGEQVRVLRVQGHHRRRGSLSVPVREQMYLRDQGRGWRQAGSAIWIGAIWRTVVIGGRGASRGGIDAVARVVRALLHRDLREPAPVPQGPQSYLPGGGRRAAALHPSLHLPPLGNAGHGERVAQTERRRTQAPRRAPLRRRRDDHVHVAGGRRLRRVREQRGRRRRGWGAAAHPRARGSRGCAGGGRDDTQGRSQTRATAPGAAPRHWRGVSPDCVRVHGGVSHRAAEGAHQVPKAEHGDPVDLRHGRGAAAGRGGGDGAAVAPPARGALDSQQGRDHGGAVRGRGGLRDELFGDGVGQ